MSLLKVALILLAFDAAAARSELFKAIHGCDNSFKLLISPIATSTASSEMACVADCLKTSDCDSVNVCWDSDILTCEILDMTSEITCGDLQQAPRCSFYKRVPQCYNGGTYNESTESCDCVFGFTGDSCERYYYDCSEAYQKTQASRGLQNLVIQPLTSPQPFLVHCYLNWGGYTYISRQQDSCPQLDFNKSWAEMKGTFGDVSCNYWLGLEKIHQLTSQATYLLDIKVTAQGGWSGHPLYTTFRVGDEASGYNLTYDGFRPHQQFAEDGFAADGVNGPNGHPFATYDHPDSGNCVDSQGVSWWYGPACPVYNPHPPLYDGAAPLYLIWPDNGGTLTITTFDAQIYTTW